MAKIKSYKVTDVKDAKKMTESVNKVLGMLELAQYVKCKTPADAWIKANAPDPSLIDELPRRVSREECAAQ